MAGEGGHSRASLGFGEIERKPNPSRRELHGEEGGRGGKGSTRKESPRRGKRWIGDEGIQWRRITVVFRQEERYGGGIRLDNNNIILNNIRGFFVIVAYGWIS